jgi:hypothetical protein
VQESVRTDIEGASSYMLFCMSANIIVHRCSWDMQRFGIKGRTLNKKYILDSDDLLLSVLMMLIGHFCFDRKISISSILINFE